MMEDARIVLPEGAGLQDFPFLRDFAAMGIIDAKMSGGKLVFIEESLKQYAARIRELGPVKAWELWRELLEHELFSYFYSQAAEHFDLLDIEPVLRCKGFFAHRASIRGNHVLLRRARDYGYCMLTGEIPTPFGFYMLDDGYLFVPAGAVNKKTIYFTGDGKSPLAAYRDNFDALPTSRSSL